MKLGMDIRERQALISGNSMCLSVKRLAEILISHSFLCCCFFRFSLAGCFFFNFPFPIMFDEISNSKHAVTHARDTTTASAAKQEREEEKSANCRWNAHVDFI